MDRGLLNSALDRFFGAYRSARYQGVIITAASEKDLRVVQAQLEALLLDGDLWSTPGADGAPDIPCSRRTFNDQVLSRRRRTLLLVAPTEWMLDWPEEDRSAFWSGVADLYGRHAVRVLAVETPELNRHLRVGFRQYRLPGTDIGVWLSRHQPIDGLQEVLQ
jgi:hypothetical protein